MDTGIVIVGQWAHVRYMDRQHLVVADSRDESEAEPVRFACGARSPRSFIWHEAPKPHLPSCRVCSRSAARRQEVIDRLDTRLPALARMTAAELDAGVRRFTQD